MPNMFLGFPVPRAKIAEMIEGYAPPLAHVARHRPNGDDPLVLPADISAGQGVVWDGVKFIGAAGGGIASAYDSPGYFFQTFFESLSGFGIVGGSQVILTGESLYFVTTTGAGSRGTLYKNPQIFKTAPSFSSSYRWKSEVRINPDSPGHGKFWLGIGFPEGSFFAGFNVTDHLLTAQWNSTTGWYYSPTIEDFGSAGYDVTRTLEVITTPTDIKFYVDGVLQYTAVANLPTTSTSFKYIFYADLYNAGSGNVQRVTLSYFKYERQIS